jgi:two-component system, NarL family, sensor kinase
MNSKSVFVFLSLLGLFVSLTTPLYAFTSPSGESGGKINLSDSLQKLFTRVNDLKYSNNAKALVLAKQSMEVAKKINTPEALTNASFLMGIAYSKFNNDSSYIYLRKAQQLADNNDLADRKPMIFYNIAMLYMAAKDYKRAIVLLDSSIYFAGRTRNYPLLSEAYNTIGNIQFDGQNKTIAKQMYDSAYKIAKQHNKYRQMGAALGNLARFEESAGNSIRLQKEAIKLLQKEKGVEEEISGILINIGYNQSNPDSALYYFSSALELAKEGNLSDLEMGAYNNMAYSYLDKGEIRKAEICLIEHAIPLAQKLDNNDWMSTLYDTYADVLAAKGGFKEALAWQKKALAERGKADQKQAFEQVRLLAALLDLTNKEQEILVQKNKLQTAQFWLVVSVLFIIGFVFMLIWIQQRNRMKLNRQLISSARQIIEMEESEKGRTARELHDITGQLVMGITGEIENLDFPDNAIKEEIKGKIKDLGKSIRLISHRMNRAMMEHFSFEELIVGQCEDVQRLTGIPISAEMPKEPLVLQKDVVLHLYRIVQELLTNAGKYVKGGEVSVRISTINNELRLNYSDNGQGFDMSTLKSDSMGLTNIHERAKLLGGKAKVNSAIGEGTTWEIAIPYVQKN